MFDITILGGGPTGLFAAFYAGLRHSSCKIIDSLPQLGGRVTAVYPEKYIYDVAGFPKVLGQVLIDQLVEQAMNYHPTVALAEFAEEITELPDGGFCLKTNKAEHLTRTLVIAAGVGSYSAKKHPAATAMRFEGKGIEYAVTDKHGYQGKDVVICGGGDSALDWANELVGIANTVTLVHRSSSFRAHEDSVIKLKKTTARVLLDTEVIEFLGSETLNSVTLKNNETGAFETIKCDSCLVMFGFNSSLGKLKEWGLDLSGESIVVNQKMETNRPGIYAAGDIAHYEGKLKLIVTGFSEAAIAVNCAKNFINPKEKIQPLHSTTIMELKEKQEARRKAQQL